MSSTKSSTTTKKATATKSTAKKAPASKTVEEKPAATEAVAAPVAPAKKEPAKRKAAEKKAAPAAEKSTPADAPADESTETEVSAPSSDAKTVQPVENHFDEMLLWMKEQSKTLRETTKRVHEMRRAYNAQIKELKKTKGKRQVSKGANRTPSGFASSSRIREPLCDFLSLDHGSLIARTLVTKRVIAYIKDNKLEEPANKRNINPDDALEKVVGGPDERLRTMEIKKQQLKEDAEAYPDNKKKQKKYANCEVTEKLTYFNLQVHLNKQFIKEDKKAVKAAEPEAEQATAAAV